MDYHHADLLESTHRLLEDRLGIECYIPVGLEWWTESFWNFGRSTYHDDRLGRQFLDRVTVENDDAHPRHHRVVTLPEALDLTWDYVVASVPDNYVGYHAFALAVGARFVIQCGNTRQPIAWELDPLVISSSETPLRGPGVVYHQEMVGFEPTPISSPTRITSLVNLMPHLVCYPALVQARELLPDYEWRIHGIDGPDGNLKPTSAVAAAMRDAGWGWHDKITGDGFGHVLHGWAATGRPLIGHRGHYVGQMGEVLWRDGETCIDLDRHAIPEAVAMIREISGTPRHQAMGDAIRATFAELVDYEAEAEAVRALLT